MKTMRLELALIVGIVFFCCWCAYIILNMNSSVSAPPTLPPANQSGQFYQRPPRLQQQQQRYQEAASSAAPNSSQLAPFSAADAYVIRANQQQQQDRHANLKPPYSTVLTAPNWTGKQAANWLPANSSPLAHLQNDATRAAQQPVPAGQWPVQSLSYQPAFYRPQQLAANYLAAPTINSHQLVANQPEETSPSHEPSEPNPDPDSAQDYAEQQQQQQQDEDVSEHPNDSETAGSEEQSSDTGRPNQEANDYEGASQADDQTEEPQREYEEQVGRRSYSEDEADANERDKNGQLVTVHRRHLINGQPVSDESKSQDRRPRRNRNQSGLPKATKKRDGFNAAEFDKLVSEIDDEKRHEQTAEEDDESPDRPRAASDGASESRLSARRQMGPSPLSLANSSRKLINSTTSARRASGSVKLEPPIERRLSKANGAAKTHAASLSVAGGKISKTLRENGFVENEPNDVDVGENSTKVTANSPDLVPKTKKDSHEHRLQESLSAQQWDDENHSLGDKDPASGGRSKQSESAINDDQLASASSAPEDGQLSAAGSEDPAEAIEFKDLDLLVNSGDFPFMESDDRRRRRRRRRQAGFDGDHGDDAGDNYAAASATDEPDNFHYDKSPSDNGTSGDMHIVSTPINSHQPAVKGSSAAPSDLANFPRVELPIANTSAMDTAEDFAIEVLDRPSPGIQQIILGNGTAATVPYDGREAVQYNNTVATAPGGFYGVPAGSYQPPLEPATLAARPPGGQSTVNNSVQLDQPAQLIQTSMRPIGSDSKKKKTKYKKFKKKKKVLAKSKLHEAKQKAAQAYKSKKKSKFKKGEISGQNKAVYSIFPPTQQF